MMDFFKNINWALLLEQRDLLEDIKARLAVECSNESIQEGVRLEGVIALITHIQDYAVDELGYDKKIVFPNMEDY